METLQITLIIAYLIVSSYFFMNWVKFFKQNRSLSVEDSFLSFVLLVIVTVLWPFVVPISFLKTLRTRKLEFSRMLPVVLAVVVVSLITLSGLAVFGGAMPQAFFYIFPGKHVQN